MSEMLIYLDGELVPREAAKVSVFDHGLLYGDGVFEGIRVYNRRIFRLDAHLDRLYDSARALALAIPLARAELAEAVRTTVRANRREDGYIRLIVTRGVGDLGVDPRSCPRPSVVVIVTDIRLYPTELYQKGLKVITSATRQVSHEAVDPRVKSLNYLKNVLAKIDAAQAGAHEGITRGALLELAAEAGIAARETRLTRFDLYTAEECFLSGTGAEVIAVTQVDGRPIGGGDPGPVTRRLQQAFQAMACNEGEPLW